MKRLLVLCLALAIGCSNKEGGAVMIPREQVPAGMIETAEKKLPDVKFDSFRKLPNGNIEVRGKNKSGKVREVEFNSAGEIVEIE